jgi:hypothetical protein
MIYADAKFGYGIKIVAGALQANGFNHAYNDDFEIDKTKLKKHKSNSFAVLAAAQMFSSPTMLVLTIDVVGAFELLE